MKLDQQAPLASVDELPSYDAIIFGTPTRFGNMTAQMRNFLDQTGGLWVKGALVGKLASVFASTGTQHGGQETTITSFHNTLLHLGMIIVGLPYSFAGLTVMDQVTGGGPYGATTLAGPGGSRDRRKAGAGCRRAGSDTEGHAESDGNRRRHGGSALTNCLARPDINPTGHGRVDTSPRARSGSEVSDRVAAAGVHRDRRTGIAGR